MLGLCTIIGFFAISLFFLKKFVYLGFFMSCRGRLGRSGRALPVLSSSCHCDRWCVVNIALSVYRKIFSNTRGKIFSKILLRSMTRFILCRLFIFLDISLSGRTEARGGGARSSLSAPSAPFLLPPFRFALGPVFVDDGKSKVFNLAFVFSLFLLFQATLHNKRRFYRSNSFLPIFQEKRLCCCGQNLYHSEGQLYWKSPRSL